MPVLPLSQMTYYMTHVYFTFVRLPVMSKGRCTNQAYLADSSGHV